MVVETTGSSTTKTVVPMKSAVLGALGMAWAWGVIAGSVGLNALIKSNQEQTRLKKLVAPTVVTIDVHDVFRSGIVLTTVSALIALVCFLSILHLLVAPSSCTNPAKALRIQAAILTFCGVWLFATIIPFTSFFATRSAKVTASLDGLQLPSSLVNQAERSLGTTSVYKKIGYLRLVAILPWITDLFTAIAAIVLFMAASGVTAPTTEAGPVPPTDAEAIVEKEKDPDVKAESRDDSP